MTRLSFFLQSRGFRVHPRSALQAYTFAHDCWRRAGVRGDVAGNRLRRLPVGLLR